ncbi:hypothetical protein NQ315_008678 [Exocentrus adspersus]|uniref:Uncharacterized protein n=1 Tax=Exocentrus adspersus TaxID=1586481 RepID=A0AAV8W6F6_9CUCU|nr:hypothetical protein NQ315_008678 [Exocentrus adspersus]
MNRIVVHEYGVEVWEKKFGPTDVGERRRASRRHREQASLLPVVVGGSAESVAVLDDVVYVVVVETGTWLKRGYLLNFGNCMIQGFGNSKMSLCPCLCGAIMKNI